MSAGGGDAPVQMPDLTDELGGQPPKGGWPGRPRAHGAQQPRGGVGVELPGCPAGQQSGEQHVQSVDRLSAGAHDVVAVLDHGAQRVMMASSTTAERNPGAVSAAMPTETASASSFLRPCPVDSMRTRVASLAGTSTASIPSPDSQVASGAPRPVAPSMAHSASGQRAANRRSCR